jgi:uncharacterized protein (TIGR02271 family)
MAITLIGLFDRSDQAQEARRKIAGEGIAESRINMRTAQTLGSNADSTGSKDHRGFFARLFGIGEKDERAGHYAEAVRRGSCVVTVNVENDAKADRVSDILESCGAIDIDQRVEQWKSSGYTGYDPLAAPYTPQQIEQEQQSFRVLQEELKVGKRKVDTGGVRVQRHTTEEPVSEQVSLHQEKAKVERHPVDRPATAAEMSAFGKDDKTIEVRETTEEPVVSKTARVVEEVNVGKQSSDRTETINEKVRRTDVDVENLPQGARPPGKPQQRPSPPARH